MTSDSETPKNSVEQDELRSLKRQKMDIPDGMSKNAWKKLQKQKKWDEEKEQYRSKRREKKHAARQRKSERKALGIVDEDANYHSQPKKELPAAQEPSGIKVIMDCAFDDLMSDKEIVSMSNQITRCYSAKRHAKYDVDLVISSFNKRLKERFDKSVKDYTKWKNLTFVENDDLRDILPKDEAELSKCVYLTADTENEIEALEAGHTYILGGIVDKNRYKELCLNKAKELGLRVGRLPIGKYIQMNSRHVLATSHVYELMCTWLEMENDWGKAFNYVLPPRKLKNGQSKEDASEEPGEASEEPKETSEEPKETPEKTEEATEELTKASSEPAEN